MKDSAEKLSRLVSRISQLQGVFEEIATKQHERAVGQGNTDLGNNLQGQANAYGDVANSLRQALNSEKSIYHLSKAADYLLVDEDDPECTEDEEG
jgi:hypothetical protein